MQSFQRFALPGVALASLAFLAGCGSNFATLGTGSPQFAGNWDIATNAAPAYASQITEVGGALKVSDTGVVSGTLHTVPADSQDGATLCYAQAQDIPVTGRLLADNTLTLTSSSFAGNTLSVRGTYAAGSAKARPSLTNATYAISGPCGVSAQAASGTNAAEINDVYQGTATLVSNGVALPFQALLSQTSDPDENGTYHLTGLAQFDEDPCVGSPVLTDSTVTGRWFSMTYTDSNTSTTIYAHGKFSSDASTLTIYRLALKNPTPDLGYCQDTGTAVLNKTASDSGS